MKYLYLKLPSPSRNLTFLRAQAEAGNILSLPQFKDEQYQGRGWGIELSLVLFHHHFIFAYLILTLYLHVHYIYTISSTECRHGWQRSMVLVMVYRNYRIFLVVGTFFREQDNLFCIWSLSRLVQDYQGLRIYQDRQGLSRIDKVYLGQTRFIQDRQDWFRIDKVSQPMIAQDRH